MICLVDLGLILGYHTQMSYDVAKLAKVEVK